jgi:hypothetical protein
MAIAHFIGRLGPGCRGLGGGHGRRSGYEGGLAQQPGQQNHQQQHPEQHFLQLSAPVW